MKAVNEDKDFYYNHEEGILAGIVITHVDDFLIVGDKKIDKIGRKDKSKLVSMKVEKDEYWFTGIDVRWTKEGISAGMDDYAASIEYINEVRKGKNEGCLTKLESKICQKYIGNLNWLGKHCRPDLAIISLNMTKRRKSSMLGDLRDVNRVIKKIRKEQNVMKFSHISKKTTFNKNWRWII